MSEMCRPTDHNFDKGGEAEGEYEAWVYCRKCGSIMMVPTNANQPGIIYPPKLNGE